jgi:hypothetical protein
VVGFSVTLAAFGGAALFEKSNMGRSDPAMLSNEPVIRELPAKMSSTKRRIEA